MISLYISNTLW